MTNELAIRILTGDVLATTKQTQEAVTMAVKALSQPERIRGRWVKSMGMNPPEYAGRYQCSECGEWAMRDIKHFKQDLTNFCPNCGADMRGGKE